MVVRSATLTFPGHFVECRPLGPTPDLLLVNLTFNDILGELYAHKIVRNTSLWFPGPHLTLEVSESKGQDV